MTFRNLFADMAPPEIGAFPIGVTGTLKGWTMAQEEALVYIALNLLPEPPTDLLHGGAVGVDEQAHYMLAGHFPEMMKHVHFGHIPDKRGRFEEGPFTYLYPPRECSARNAHVVTNVKALFVVSRLPYEILRSGTWQTARMFGGINRRSNVRDRPMYVIWPDGLWKLYLNDFHTEMNQQTVIGTEAQEWGVPQQGRHFREDY